MLNNYKLAISRLNNKINSEWNSVNTYQDRTKGALEDVTTTTKNTLKQLSQDITNKKRMIEINNYYRDKYADYIFIVKLFILLCAISIILSMLVSRSLISKSIYTLLLVISGSIIVGFMLSRGLSTLYRDPVNYNEYKFYVPPYTPTKNIRAIRYKENSGDNEFETTYYGKTGDIGATTYKDSVGTIVGSGSVSREPGAWKDY